MRELEVVLLTHSGCPSVEEARERLARVMAEEGIEVPIKRVDVATDEMARALAFPGSPTIRIDGVDIDPRGAADNPPALTCRVYRLPGGKVSPLPSEDMIRVAFRARAG